MGNEERFPTLLQLTEYNSEDDDDTKNSMGWSRDDRSSDRGYFLSAWTIPC